MTKTATKKEVVHLVIWDEIGGEAWVAHEDEKEGELELSWPIAKTISGTNAREIRHLIRSVLPDEDPDLPESEQGWSMDEVGCTPNAITTEWRSDRGHLSVITIIRI